MLGAKIIYAEDAEGSVGKRPVTEPHLFDLSAESYIELAKPVPEPRRFRK